MESISHQRWENILKLRLNEADQAQFVVVSFKMMRLLANILTDYDVGYSEQFGSVVLFM